MRVLPDLRSSTVVVIPVPVLLDCLGKAAGDCQRVPLSRVDKVPGLDDDLHLVPAVQRRGRRADPFDGVLLVDGHGSGGVISAVGGLDGKVQVVDDTAGAANRPERV